MAKFLVTYMISGTATTTIEADSLDVAKSQIDAEINDDEFEIDLDKINDVDYRVAEMHPVTRNGHEIWTTNVKKDDKRGHASALKETPLFMEA